MATQTWEFGQMTSFEKRVWELSLEAKEKRLKRQAEEARRLQFERRRLFRTSLRSIRIARRAPVLRVRLWGPQR